MQGRPKQVTDARLQKQAVAYVRRASLEQGDAMTGSNVQLDLVKLMESWGYPRDRIVLIDDSGISSVIPGARPGFRRLLELIRSGVVGLVAVRDVSRLGRNPADLIHFISLARGHDVVLWCAGEIVEFGGLRGCNAFLTTLDTAGPPLGYVATSPGFWRRDHAVAVREAIQRAFARFRS